MIRKVGVAAVAVLCVVSIAWAEDDDGVQGNWAGKFTSAGWEQVPIAAELVARSAERWKTNLLVGEDKQRARSGEGVDEVAGVKQGAAVRFSGKADLGEKFGGMYDVGGEISGNVFKGTLSQRGAKLTFEMQRVFIKPPSFDAKPPEGAVVLLDGSNLDHWIRVPEKWNLVEEGAMQVSSSSLKTKEEFGSFKLHIEFRTPFMPNSTGQSRGNSGVYIHGRYEVQVLDSFGLPPADNDCGGIYKQAVPRVCASLPPLQWQTYDITFTAPKFDASGKKTDNAVLTVEHNGIVIHDKLSLTSATPGGLDDIEGLKGAIMLQDHDNSVRYRNIWIKEM